MPKSTNVERATTRRNRATEILPAAIKVFSEKGYAAASLQDLADEVGLLKGSLYHYIDSKESVLFDILQGSHAQAVEIMVATDALDLEPEQRFASYIRSLTLWYLSNRERASLYFTEWRYLTGEFRDTVLEQRHEFLGYVRQILAEAQRRDRTRKDIDVQLAALFVMSAVNSVPIWFRDNGRRTAEQIADEVAALACATMFPPAS